MKCSEFKKNVSDLVSDEVEGPKASIMSEHMSICKDCREVYANMKTLAASLRNLSGHAVPEDCWESVSSRIGHNKPHAGMIFWQWKLIAAPAALALIVAGYLATTPDKPANVVHTAPRSQYTDYINIHAGTSANQPWADTDIYVVNAGMQSFGDR